MIELIGWPDASSSARHRSWVSVFPNACASRYALTPAWNTSSPMNCSTIRSTDEPFS